MCAENLCFKHWDCTCTFISNNFCLAGWGGLFALFPQLSLFTHNHCIALHVLKSKTYFLKSCVRAFVHWLINSWPMMLLLKIMFNFWSSIQIQIYIQNSMSSCTYFTFVFNKIFTFGTFWIGRNILYTENLFTYIDCAFIEFMEMWTEKQSERERF